MSSLRDFGTDSTETGHEQGLALYGAQTSAAEQRLGPPCPRRLLCDAQVQPARERQHHRRRMLGDDWRLHALHVGEQYGAIAHGRHADATLDARVQELDPADLRTGLQQPGIAPADDCIGIGRVLDRSLDRVRDHELHVWSGRLQVFNTGELQIADDDLLRPVPPGPLADETSSLLQAELC